MYSSYRPTPEPRVVRVWDSKREETTIMVEEFPSVCPVCARSIEPVHVHGAFTTRERLDTRYPFKAELVFRCAFAGCLSLFIGYYDPWNHGGETRFLLQATAPVTPTQAVLSDTVVKFCPRFGAIYQQAHKAEELGLEEVAGMGYRKALEFLIKDYAISKNPGKEDEIKKAMLGHVIGTSVEDANIRKTAKLAAWLGNDEAHYERRWESKDVKDLKMLIRITCNWIDSALLTQSYADDMDPDAKDAG